MTNVKSGDRVKLTAREVNSWNEAANAFRTGKLDYLESLPSLSNNPVVITIQNKTGDFAGLFSVLSIGKSINLTGSDIERAMPNAFNKEAAFEGQEPTGDGAETVCITLGVAENGNTTPAVLLGAVGCVVDVSDVDHRYAVPVQNDITKLESSESGVIRILNPVTQTGEQFCYILLGGGGASAAPSVDQTITLITPLTNGFTQAKVAANAHVGEETSPAGYNGQGAALGKLSTQLTGDPLKVFTVDSDVLTPKQDGGNQLYYKDIAVQKKNDYVQFSGTRYQVAVLEASEEEIDPGDWFSVPCLYAFLSSLKEEASADGLSSSHFDYSDRWETTTDPNEAITDNYVVVKPHNHPGYKAYLTQCKVSGSEPLVLDVSDSGNTREASTVIYSVTPTVSAQVKMKGQVDWSVYQAKIEDDLVEWEKIETRADALDNLSGVKAVVIDYDGTHPAVGDNNKIENMCSTPYIAGLWIDNGIPQWVSCEGIPYNMCIPILYVGALYRISGGECSPSYLVHSYPVKLEQYLSVSAVNYIPTYKNS